MTKPPKPKPGKLPVPPPRSDKPVRRFAKAPAKKPKGKPHGHKRKA